MPPPLCKDFGPCTAFLHCGNSNEGTACYIRVRCNQDAYVVLTDYATGNGFGSSWVGPFASDGEWNNSEAWEWYMGYRIAFAGYFKMEIYQMVGGILTLVHTCTEWFNCK